MEDLGGQQIAHTERQSPEGGPRGLRVHSFEWKGLGVCGALGPLKAAEGESLKTWVSRASELFDRCQRKCNVSFPEEARGWIILRRSGLTEEQQAVVLARSLGVLKREEVSRAMRSCYPDITAPRKRAVGAGMVEDAGGADASSDLHEPWDDGETFEDVEQFLAQHELIEVENDDEPENVT